MKRKKSRKRKNGKPSMAHRFRLIFTNWKFVLTGFLSIICFFSFYCLNWYHINSYYFTEKGPEGYQWMNLYPLEVLTLAVGLIVSFIPIRIMIVTLRYNELGLEPSEIETEPLEELPYIIEESPSMPIGKRIVRKAEPVKVNKMELLSKHPASTEVSE